MSTPKIKKIFFCVGISLCVFIMGTVAFGTEELKLTHLRPHPLDTHTAAMARVFKSLVETGSGGAIRVEISATGTRRDEREIMEQVQRGETQSYIASCYIMLPYYSLYDIINLPFAYSSYAVAYDVFDSSFGVEMAEDIRKKTGFRVLGFPEYAGFFQTTNSKRPIRSLEDMKGLTMRPLSHPVNPLHMEVIRALGTSPTPIAWPELYASLKNGVVDGQMNPIEAIILGKLHEVQQYITLTNHLYSSYVWVINDRWYQSLSPRLKEIIVDSARTAIAAGRGIARASESEKLLPLIADKLEIYGPTAAELARFRKVALPAARKHLEEKLGDEGARWIEKVLMAISEAENRAKSLAK
ncbi:MAG: TRAP transporter substrate-binding protein DctP [Deltaproteobacteria bacterium]|nr:MAG: TRAP transporter substrate-binding protein DctP [Deltaproteobacteria bacterium]